jgi:hypothetical protein
MPETIVGLFWTAVGAYAATGIAFAVPFVLFWSARLDPEARAGSWGFRLAILPGAAALWPLLGWKTLRAFRETVSPPDPEEPVSPATQRLIHGVSMLGLALVVPVIGSLAILYRPSEHPSERHSEPPPLADSVNLRNPVPGGLPVHASLRTDGTRDQLELEVSRSIDEPVVALFWSPQAQPNRLASDAIFLGSLWGPAKLLFDLPGENHQSPGTLFFVALTDEQRVVAKLSLDPL